MFAEERYIRIIELVNQQGKMTVAELSRILQVSSVTIRRDLEKLEEGELLIRTHGGAISVDATIETRVEKSFFEKKEALSAEKEKIAEAAAHLVQDDEAILLSPGTTNMLLAKKLIHRKQLTLVTNAANIATYIAEQSDLDVILIGGKLRKKSFAMVGPIAEEALKNIRVDKLFLGVDGLDINEGLTTPNLPEANMDRQMINIAKKVIVVADHTKFGRVMFSHIAPLEDIHTIITDNQLNKEYIQQIRDLGIHLVLV